MEPFGEIHPPEECSLDVRSVAAVLRTGAMEQDYANGEIRKLTEDLEKERERSKGLAGRGGTGGFRKRSRTIGQK